ncbi:hypothetical protein PR048_008408 [Dryococelus australis]|uniref:C2H2-type domain-containing protein n=1 Tax=Dryococelus australis TaxID=614101 RepID=A0ABQ9HX23_9NEOP|nr:hypothetical protein PR048_008408 [Dryococelus australis]
MKMDSSCSEPITIYKLIKWPAHFLGSRILHTHSSSVKEVSTTELSQSPSQLFEIVQSGGSTIATSDLPENSAYLASKILERILERRALKQKKKKEMCCELVQTSVAQMCPYCQKSYSNPFHWRRHVNTHTGEVKYPCSLCGKVFLDKSTMLRHKKIHNGEKPWRCKMCNKCFHTLPSLRRHTSVHNPAGRPFECNICHKRFPDRSSQQKHIFIHTGLRPHVCSVCNKSFVHVGDLNCHMKIHADTKEFNCPHCKKEFAKLGNYQRHVKIHEGTMAYRCPVCHIDYNFRSSLTRHMLVHRQEKLRKSCIICRFCDARFLNRSALKRHLLHHFAEKVEQKYEVSVQSKNSDSKNDINERPLTYKEICFVRRNLKYCRVVHLDKLPKNDDQILLKNDDRREIIYSSSEAGQNQGVKNITLNCGSELLASGVSNESSKYGRYLAGHADQGSEIVTNKCDSVGTLRKKCRGRPRKLHPNSVAPSSHDSRKSAEQKGAVNMKSEVSAVGKRRRGRPRKVMNSCANKEVCGENNEMPCKSIELNSNDVSELKQTCSRSRINLSIAPNKLPEIQLTKNSDCIMKRKRGRPRKINKICSNRDKHEIESKDMNFDSREDDYKCTVEQKRKRGRPRKSKSERGAGLERYFVTLGKGVSKCTADEKRKRGRPRKVFCNESYQCQSIVKENREIVVDGKVNEKVMLDVGEESLHDETRKESGNFKTSNFKSADVGTENEQKCGIPYADLGEAVLLGENSQTSKIDEKMGKILQQRGGHKDWTCDAARLQKHNFSPEPTKNCSSVTVIPGSEKKLLKQRAKRKMPVFITHVNKATEEYNTGQSNKSNVFFRETEVEGCGQAKNCTVNEKEVTYVENTMEKVLLCNNEFQGSQQTKHFVTNMAEVTCIENKCKKTKPGQEKGCLLFQGGEEVTAEVQECGADVKVMKDIVCMQELRELQQSGDSAAILTDSVSVKAVLLDDWQSDNSCSSGTLEIVWENIDCGALQG